MHGARLRGSQEDVVIKVLKPGIEDVLVADLNFVYVVARILEFLNPELSRASLVWCGNFCQLCKKILISGGMGSIPQVLKVTLVILLLMKFTHKGRLLECFSRR